MGQGMIQNLAKHHKVLAFDTNPAFMKNLKSTTNITSVKSIRDITGETDTFVLMLPSEKICRNVCENEIFATARKNTLILDCSTISPFASRELNALGLKKGMTYVDAPVSGGVGGASAGTLSFMVGSENEGI
jgi:3-hydroxyisobutyrate dehydrogenase